MPDDAEQRLREIEAADFGNCSAIIDREELNDDDANSELNTTIIRTGDKKTIGN